MTARQYVVNDQVIDRFMAKVEPQPDGCWLWMARVAKNGYGHFGARVAATQAHVKTGAHRVAYEAFVGALPPGLTVDHLCFNKRCVNPAHLDLVTPAENTRRSNARRTHCCRGHILAGDNIRMLTDGRGRQYRQCLTCARASWVRYRAKKSLAKRLLVEARS